jgi:hypothetical protein
LLLSLRIPPPALLLLPIAMNSVKASSWRRERGLGGGKGGGSVGAAPGAAWPPQGTAAGDRHVQTGNGPIKDCQTGRLAGPTCRRVLWLWV